MLHTEKQTEKPVQGTLRWGVLGPIPHSEGNTPVEGQQDPAAVAVTTGRPTIGNSFNAANTSIPFPCICRNYVFKGCIGTKIFSVLSMLL